MNVIVTPAGLNVHPEDLESAVKKQSAIRDCVVVPLDRGGNAEPCAVLLLSPPHSNDDAAARAAIESACADIRQDQRMRSWITWPEPDFPRTPTGKPRLSVIAGRAVQILSGGRAESVANGALNPLRKLLSRFAQSAAPANQLEKDLNLSSLDRVELMSALEEKFHVELNETEFSNSKTVADVERLLQQPAARRTEYLYPRWTQREPVRWLRLAVYYALVWPATQILGHPRILGRENLRSLRGPILIV